MRLCTYATLVFNFGKTYGFNFKSLHALDDPFDFFNYEPAFAWISLSPLL